LDEILTSTARVRGCGSVDKQGTAKLAYRNELDVIFNALYGDGIKNLKGKAKIPFKRDRYSTAIIKPIDFDFLSRFLIPYQNALASTVKVAGTSELDVAYRLIQSPRQEEILVAVQDTYTRESRPTLNHGGRETLITGVLPEGSYVSYIDMDISFIKQILINEGMINKSIELMLNLAVEGLGKIEIIECLNSWDEYSATWLTPMTLGDTLMEIDVTNTAITVDIAQIVLNLIQSGKTRLNIAVKSDSLFFIRSRESELPPRIRFRYSDPNWMAFSDEYNMMSSALIQARTLNDFPSIINIMNKFVLNSSAIIKKLEDNLASTAHVQSDYGYSNMRSKVITSKLRSDLYSSAMVKSTLNSNDKHSTYYQPSIQQPGTANLKITSEMYSTTTILSETISNGLEGRADILLNSLKSIVNILNTFTMESRAVLIASDLSNLNSKVEISKLENDLHSQVILREMRGSIMPGSAEIIGGSLLGSYRLGKSTELSGHAWIMGRVHSDMSSTITTVSREIVNLPSKATILSSSQHDISSNLDIKLPLDLPAVAYILQNTLLNSHGIIRQFDLSEVESHALLGLARSFNRLASVAIIRRREYNYFSSRVLINTSARKWIPNVHGQSTFNYADRKLPRLWVRENFIND
jgi:hypothetical protein